MQSYCERLIERFGVFWGKQKVLSQFGSTPQEIQLAKDAWEAQLRSVSPETIKQVLEHIKRDPPAWPPSLADWIQLCKQFDRPEHRPALPMPEKQITEAGKQIIENAVQQMRTQGFDYLHWAKFPKSAQAIMLLKRGIKDDKRLADIWNHHLATDGADCQPAAREQLLAMKASYQTVEVD